MYRSLLLSLLLVSQIYAAPAPLPKPTRPELVESLIREDFIGEWTIEFPNEDWTYTFHKDGSFVAALDEYHYCTGMWRLTTINQINIVETTAPKIYLPNFYTITLSQDKNKFNRFKSKGRLYYPSHNKYFIVLLTKETK